MSVPVEILLFHCWPLIAHPLRSASMLESSILIFRIVLLSSNLRNDVFLRLKGSARFLYMCLIENVRFNNIPNASVCLKKFLMINFNENKSFGGHSL